LRILNHTQNTVLAEQFDVANTFFRSMRGLIGRRVFPAGEALILPHCSSIHMFFMRFPIDVVFIDKKNTVVGLLSDIPPNTLSPIFWRAHKAIELPAGTIGLTRTKVHDKLRFL
jgi:uncharacterized membrane protein (UPF0127 family)